MNEMQKAIVDLMRELAESLDNLVDAIQCLTNQIKISRLLREAGESE